MGPEEGNLVRCPHLHGPCQRERRQVDWAASGQVPARLSAQADLDPVNYPSNILLGQTFTEYGVMDPRTTVTQELLTYLDAELSNALNGMKTPEQALNDAAKLMQEALDRG